MVIFSEDSCIVASHFNPPLRNIIRYFGGLHKILCLPEVLVLRPPLGVHGEPVHLKLQDGEKLERLGSDQTQQLGLLIFNRKLIS